MKHFLIKSDCILLSALLLSTALIGCGETGMGSSSTSSNNFFSSTQSVESVVMQDKNKVYLEEKEGKFNEYNDAIKAYNQFLNKKIKAKDKRMGKMIGVNDAWNSVTGKTGIGSFALYDVNNDDIPELHIISNNYDVFSYQNRQLWHWYTSNSNTMHGSTYILESGALFSEILSTGYSYYYTTFDSDGTVSELEMLDPGENYEGAKYYFDGKEVSKEEYERLSKKYMDLAKKKSSY